MRMISSHWEWIVIALVFAITSPSLFFRRQRRAARLRAMTDPVDVWAIALFPRGVDQVIPQVLAVFLVYFPLVFPVGMTRAGALFGR